MKTKIVLTLGLALSATVLAAGPNREGEPGTRQAKASQAETRQLSRKQAVYELVLKWGPEAARTQARSIHDWANSMVPLFGTADVANLNKALKAKTYTGMVNTLTGTQAPSTSKLIGVTPMSLGSTTSDLVYTPLPSCVIVNTTKPGSGGAMTAGSVRHLKASGATFVTQGGEDSNCGIPAGMRALLVSVTSAAPSTSGYFRLWAYGTSEPLAANMSYTSGQLIQNEIVMATSVGLAADFSVRSSGSSHLIINVLGYFAAPVATALECTDTEAATVNIAANSGGSVDAPACPAGYGMTATYCYGDFGAQTKMSTMYNSFGESYCVYQNGNAFAITVGAKNRCCRVPGR
jgi:hypothetical protein